jgi:TolA-binding protein
MSLLEHPKGAENLLARARRGELSESEQRVFDGALEASSTLRVAHLVGSDVDRASAVRAGDEDLISRAADAALARAASGVARTAPRRRRRFLTAALVAAAMISATGMAAALRPLGPSMLPMWMNRYANVNEPGRVTTLKRPQLKLRLRDLPASAAPALAPVPALETSSSAVPEMPVPPVVPFRSGRANRIESSAADLFRQANGARRAGEFARAKRLYTDLIAQYPESDEARLAQVSLGKLLLAQGEPSAAERSFGRYLSSGQGQLAEEALVSQAQSFERMKRSSEEQQVWQRLLSEHPDSVYAAQAKARLEALRRAFAKPGP